MLVYSSKIIVNDCLSSGGARNGIQFWLSEWGWGTKNEHRGRGRIWAPMYGLDRRPNNQGEAAGALTKSPQQEQAGQYCRCDPGASRPPPSLAPVVFPVEEGLDGAFHLQGGRQQYWGLGAQETARWLLDCQNNSRDSFSVTNHEEVLNAPYGI